MDWLLPLRVGENDECRTALRSWVANAGLSDDDRLVTVGDRPDWLEPDLHIPGNYGASGPVKICGNIRDACASGLLAETAIVVNDDMYALEPTDPTAIFYRSSLAEHIARLPQKVSWWASSMRLTMMSLRRRGVEHPLSYELHRPLLIRTEDMARVLAESWTSLGIPPQWRTLYGNLCEIGGDRARDRKVVTRANWPQPGPWVSSTDGSWRWLRDEIEPLFPEPTRWER